MKQVFSATATNNPAIDLGAQNYHYGAWNNFSPIQTPDNPLLTPLWAFPRGTAVKIVAIKASLQGVAGARPALSGMNRAICLQLGFSQQRAGERRTNLVIPTWDEWFDLDIQSFPNEDGSTRLPRFLQASPNPGLDLGDLFTFDPRNMQAFYSGQLMCPFVLVMCEFSGNLVGVNP